MAYAYLQRGEDEKADQVMEALWELTDNYQVHIAASYTFYAIPARITLERKRWAEASALVPGIPEDYPGDRFPATKAITHFARALGAARIGESEAARAEIDHLTALRQKAEKTSAYWAKQVEIQRLSATAWLKYEEGEQEEALNVMRSAARLEASTEKHPVTPGEVLPARELLADMLLEMGHHREARIEYEAALKRSKNRFNSLYGAGRAAELQGDQEGASYYYNKLVSITAANSKRDALRQARTYLAAN
jgi:hypothetical protein